MLASSVPVKFALPFAAAAGAGFITTIPAASQITITPGRASLTDGFVPLNMTPIPAGGIPPFGQDMNGILNITTAAVQWLQAGGLPFYDATFSAAIGGYPNGAMIRRADGAGFWISSVDNNVSNPDSGGANWSTVLFSGGSGGAIIGQGLCKFGYSSVSTALLTPLNGAAVFINGSYTLIPAAGLPLAASLQTDNTDYNAYVYNYTSNISGVANNGSGLFRLTVGSTTNLANGYPLTVSGTAGAAGLNGSWTVNVIDATHVDLVGSTFAAGYTSGGALLGPVVFGSTTSHVTGTNGAQVMNGDATKSWVGKFRLNGSAQFQQDSTKWLIRSAFNDTGFAAESTGTCSVMFLPSELYRASSHVDITGSTANGSGTLRVNVDGSAVGMTSQAGIQVTGQVTVTVDAEHTAVLAEGTHTFTQTVTTAGTGSTANPMNIVTSVGRGF